MAENLIHKFNLTATLYSQRTAIQYKDKGSWLSMPYGELWEKIESLSGFLLEEGIKRGDNIAIILKNSPAWPMSFFAILSAGAVAIPVNPDASSQEIDNILKDSQSRMVFAEKESFLHGEDIKLPYPFIKKAIDIDSEEFTAILQPRHNKRPDRNIDIKDLACILYTSGTTGVPKGVMLSHRNLLANCGSLNKLKIIKDNDSVVSVLPLHHAYPLTITMLLPLLYGAKIIYPESIKSEDISEAMLEANPSVFVGVPQFFHALHKKITGKLKRVPFPFNILFKLVVEILYCVRKITGINMTRFMLHSMHKKFGNSMRLFTSGGAKLNEKVARDLLKLGFTISEGYGLSETSPVLTFNPPDRPKIGSAGISIPGVELKIAGPDEKGIGEVTARGPNIMEGYYKRDGLTKEVIKQGWFYTGDLGFFDGGGYLFLTGRSKEIIALSSGLNIYPEEIEEAYTKDVPIKEICVFEALSPKGIKSDFVLWAVVRPDLDFFKKYGEVNLRHVIKERLDNVSKSLPVYNRIMGFSITLEDLPRTTLGKLKRFEVKNIYAGKITQSDKGPVKETQLSPEDRKVMESETAKKIIARLKRHFNIKEGISPADSLEIDLGIDSLGRIELTSMMEEAFQVKIKDEVIGRAFTVKDLIIELEVFLKDADKILYDGKAGCSYGKNYWQKTLKVLPEKENLDKIDLSPGIFTWIAGFLFLLPFYVFFKVFYRLKVEGAENVSKISRHILYANHTSYFDGLLLGVALPRFPKLDMFFIGFRPYFNVIIIRSLIKIGRIIPLDFSSHLTGALRSCYYVLDNDKNLCIFPEGLRTLDGNIGEFKKGFGILAKESNAKLVPVLLDGTYEAWPRTSRFPRMHPIKVKFGRALDVSELEKIGLQSGASDNYSAICMGARKVLIELKEGK